MTKEATRDYYDVRVDEYIGTKSSVTVFKFNPDCDCKMKGYKYYRILFKPSDRIYFVPYYDKVPEGIKYSNYMLQFGKKELREKLKKYHGEYPLKKEDAEGHIYYYIDLKDCVPLQKINPNRKSEIVRTDKIAPNRRVYKELDIANGSEFYKIVKERVSFLESEMEKNKKKRDDYINQIGEYRKKIEELSKSITDLEGACQKLIDEKEALQLAGDTLGLNKD